MASGVGTILREARNRRKVELAEVEAATRIRVRFLRAIEDEEWDVLPGGVYTRGFIRTYASFLGPRRRAPGRGLPRERRSRHRRDDAAAARAWRRQRRRRGLAASLLARPGRSRGVAVAAIAIVAMPGGGGG